MNGRYWYLATPYTNYPAGRPAAHADACIQAGMLMHGQIAVFSPIAHTHPIADIAGMHNATHAFWMQVDRPMMNGACGLIVCRLPGWDTSRGVREEIEVFRRACKPIVYMDPGVIPARLYEAEP